MGVASGGGVARAAMALKSVDGFSVVLKPFLIQVC